MYVRMCTILLELCTLLVRMCTILLESAALILVRMCTILLERVTGLQSCKFRTQIRVSYNTCSG